MSAIEAMKPKDVFPDRRAEDWRWTDLSFARTLVDVPAAANDGHIATDHLWLDIEGARHLFAGGRGEGKPAPILQAPAHPLADMAAAEARAGMALEVAAGSDAGVVQLLHLGTGGSAHGVTSVRLGAGAKLVLVENFADTGSDHWLNHRFDAELGHGAQLVRIVHILNNRGLVTERGWARVGADAIFREVVLSAGVASSRAEVQVDLVGAGARAFVNGALLGAGKAHADVLVHLNHQVPKTQSDQLFRLVGKGRANLSVAGTVHVARQAQETLSKQLLGGLVLERSAQCNLKPELEIYADDVKCDHGATVGELDENALFYLKSRGLPEREAEVLLTEAFVADVFHDLPDGIGQVLEAEGTSWLGRES